MKESIWVTDFARLHFYQIKTKDPFGWNIRTEIDLFFTMQGLCGGVFLGKVESYFGIGGDGLERYIH